MRGIGYSLQALHLSPFEPIVSIELSEAEGKSIIAKLWSEENLWTAPSGRSFGIGSPAEADAINNILGTRTIELNPSRHRWCFHMYLLDSDA